VGSVRRHLSRRDQVNLIDPLTGERSLGQFSQFGFKANDGNDSFNALQLTLAHRMTHGLLGETQYMWSHAITDASSGAGESVSSRTWDAALAIAATHRQTFATRSARMLFTNCHLGTVERS
jgi:hypothetical protein